MTMHLPQSQPPLSEFRQWLTLQLSQANTVLLGLVCCQLAITVPLAAVLNIWVDEIYTWQTTSRDLSYAVDQAIHFEMQAPLYFIMITLLRQINNSVFMGRLLSVVCVAAIAIGMNLISRRLWKTLNPAWATAFVVFNPYLIKMAVDLRSYALISLMSVALVGLFELGYLNNATNNAKNYSRNHFAARIGYMIIAIAGLYTHYFIGILLIAHGVVLLGLGQWRSLRTYTIQMLLVGAGFAPMLVYLAQQVTAMKASFATANQGISSALFTTIGSALSYVFPFTHLPGVAKYGIPVVVLTIALGIVGCYRARIQDSHRAAAIATLSTIAILIVILNLSNLGSFARRYGYALLPWAVLSWLGLCTLLPSRLGHRLLATSLSIALILSAAQLKQDYQSLAKPGDWQRVATYLVQTVPPTQPIVVFNATNHWPLEHYYNPLNRVSDRPLTVLPHELTVEEYDLSHVVLKDEAAIWQALAPIHDRLDTLWLVSTPNDTCKVVSVDFGCTVLAEFLNKNYQLKSEQTFYKSQVQQFVRRLPQA